MRIEAHEELAGLLTPGEYAAVSKCGPRTAEQLLRYAPSRYLVPGNLTQIAGLDDGDEATVKGRVVDSRTVRLRKRPGMMLTATLGDGTAEIDAVFFGAAHLIAYWEKQLGIGQQVLLQGTVKTRPGHGPQLTHPQIIPADDAEAVAQAMRPVPVYPLVDTAKSKQKHLRGAIGKIISAADSLTDTLPESLRRAYGLPRLAEALREMHQPVSAESGERARRYLACEEAFLLQLVFAQRRYADSREKALPLAEEGPLQQELTSRLPYSLTAGQRAVSAQIAQKISQNHPASILLQGDVGAGKTVLALLAMLRAVDSGAQAVLLAPTEVLAQQHAETIRGLLGDLARAGTIHAPAHATRVHLLTGSASVSQRREALLACLSGEAGIIVGTHALLSENVTFHRLGLVVIDEQHRFGVNQRATLRESAPTGLHAHVIVMTATPIPRTAALAMLGDLDALTLHETPAVRAGVTSHYVPESAITWNKRMWQRVDEELAAGRRAFVVCPRINQENEGGHSVTQTAQTLAAHPDLPHARIATLHGQQSAEQKTATMRAFANGESNLLVSTTVIEVGVDIPDATAMVILDAERFGLSQLHQLRGRVGRSHLPGICFLVSSAPPGSDSADRLAAVAATTDGFALAEIDLRYRRQGELTGTSQAGTRSELKYLDLLNDAQLIVTAREHAEKLITKDPELAAHPATARALRRFAAAEQIERS
ncbi:ATP-dependent DNA helicase RecG [Dermabacteraceae bacterium TAE3-ERU27]|nr:ATP-dependent DNA helicase RecG [Dermabacteraceae bacterium TAE3-ERU27]